MDYRVHYQRLIDRAKNRVITGYTEQHHIKPKCLGGSNDADNLVRLTAEEHYVAHQLLVKMHPKDHRLLWALSAMTNKTARMKRPQNKRYAWLRRRFAEMAGERTRGRKHTAEARAKMVVTRARQVIQHSEETRAKMSAAKKGRVRSLEHCAAISGAHTGKKLPPRSEEWNRNHAASMRLIANTRDLSFTQNADYRAGQSARMKQIWAERRLKQKG